MRKLNLALLLVAMMIPFACAAQQPSEYVGLIIFDGGGNPIPAPSTGTDVGPLPQTYVGALCWNSGLSKWVKADSSCFGGSGGTFTALTQDATSTATGGTTEVVGLLTHLLPSLTTGYLNWTGSAWALNAVGTGTVNTGTTGQLAYYPVNGTAVSGSPRVYVAPVGGSSDDTANIQAAINAGVPILLDAPNYNITSLTAGPGLDIQCSFGTTLNETSATGNPFTITSASATVVRKAHVEGCTIIPASGVTPTAGAVFNLSETGGSFFEAIDIRRNFIAGMWQCFQVGNGILTGWINANTCNNSLQGAQGFMLYDNLAPAGDLRITDNLAAGVNTGLTFGHCDTTNFLGQKLNGAGITFNRTGICNRVFFNQISIEGTNGVGGQPNCGVDFGTGGTQPTNIQFIGGGIGIMPFAFCNDLSFSQFTYTNLNIYSTAIDTGGIAPSGSDSYSAGTSITLPAQQTTLTVGESSPSLITGLVGFESSGARSLWALISTTNNNNTGIEYSAKDSGGSTHTGGIYFVPGTTTATTSVSVFPNNSTAFAQFFADGHSTFGSSGQTSISSTGAVVAATLAAVAARRGTFVCTAAGTITITNSNAISTSDIIITMNTAGGTITTSPAMKTPGNGTNFTVLCGATDTSTYNYDILN